MSKIDLKYAKLTHYGIKGMKWGVRRTPAQLGRGEAKKRTGSKLSELFKPDKRNNEDTRMSKKSKEIRKLSSEELTKRIERLDLEKKYLTLLSETRDRGKKTTTSILGEIGAKSVQNIGSQLTTYGLGKAVNKLFGDEIVNPKKGQKDK